MQTYARGAWSGGAVFAALKRRVGGVFSKNGDAAGMAPLHRLWTIASMATRLISRPPPRRTSLSFYAKDRRFR